MLAWTDPDERKPRGILFLIFPMRSQSVLVQMTGHSDFNEVLFENVHVPTENRLCEENRGWYVSATLMDFGRSDIGSLIRTHKSLVQFLERAKAVPAEQPQLAQVRLQFAERMVESEVSLLFSYRVMTMYPEGLVSNHETSMAKMFGLETNQRIGRTSVSLFGPHVLSYYSTLNASAT
jgi:alkylation response protein AidB-like acyl-CoA dehydrogenase